MTAAELQSFSTTTCDDRAFPVHACPPRELAAKLACWQEQFRSRFRLRRETDGPLGGLLQALAAGAARGKTTVLWGGAFGARAWVKHAVAASALGACLGSWKGVAALLAVTTVAPVQLTAAGFALAAAALAAHAAKRSLAQQEEERRQRRRQW